MGTHAPTRARGERHASHPAPRSLSYALVLLGLAAPALSQRSPLLEAGLPEAPLPQPSALALAQTTQSPAVSSSAPALDQEAPGSVRGLVLDRDGAMVPGAHISLTQQTPGHSSSREAISAPDGTFVFLDVPPGTFNLSVITSGFATQITSGLLRPGETEQLSPITLRPGVSSEVEVTLTRTEIAEDQIHAQEKQRVLGALPNYYVSYIPNALPLSRRQKYDLAWKTSIDPVTFAVTGIISGFQQANDDFNGYHQGTAGYAKRFGANYADLVSGTFIGGAVLPSLLHQDPRYFYKGSGSVRSRLGYAIATAVICKGDDGQWQPNYSGIIGSLAAGGISNLYYPDSDRDGAGLTFRNTLIGTGTTAIQNIFQEFLVRKLTPRLPKTLPPPSVPVPASTRP